jgi:hypothetical protein
MKLEDYSTEQLLAELEKRKVSINEVDFKMQKVDGVKWSDLTLHYTIEESEFTGNKYLKVAPFVDGKFCYDSLGQDVDNLLPSCLSESQECIYEYHGEPEVGIQHLQKLGFKMERNDEFFNW